MNKFKRALALVLAVAMTVSLASVAPSTTASAASKKYVKSLKLSKSKLTIASGKSASITATVKVKGSASKKVKVSLSSANKKIIKKVKVGKPSKKGVSKITFTAKKVTKKKSTTVKVVTNSKNSKGKKITKTVKVTVKPEKPTQPTEVVPTSVTATITKSTINVGEGAVVTAKVLPANAKTTLTYTSSNPKVASVTSAGVVLGVSAGKATITVKTANGKTASVNVTVVNVEATGIKLDKTTVEVFVSGKTTLTATVTPSNAVNKTVTWSSSNEAVATVKDGEVTGIAKGTATITAKTANGLTATCVVTVKENTILADGVTMKMTNPYEDGTGKEYQNTKLMGDEMFIQVRVVKNGQPVGNTNVNLKLEALYGNCNESDFEVRIPTVTTDANGYANFTVGLRQGVNYDAVSEKFQSLILTATETGSNQVAELTVKYGTIAINGITVLNGYNGIPAIEPSDEASDTDDGIYETYYLDDTKPVEYVTSQQVSSSEDDHRVYFTAAPYLVLPATRENAHIGDWEYKVSTAEGTSGSCSVYNDALNETTTVQVMQIPKGLRNITLHFDKVDLSAYTTLNVDIYSYGGSNLHHAEYTDGSNLSGKIQIEEQFDVESFIVVSLISQGQVDTVSQGYVLTRLTGVWASTNDELTTLEEIAGSVTWTDVTSEVGYENVPWSHEKASDYFPEGSPYLNPTYEYDYMIPAYPHTGDAIIIVKDANGEQKANFLYPTANNGKNKNVMIPKDAKISAIPASNEEARNQVGTLTTDDNVAIVDSQKSGITILKATVKVAGLSERELNAQNGGILYTSVQWSPVPKKETVVELPDYFAMEGQDVVVTAKLYDTNGNKKSESGKKVTFKDADGVIDTTEKTVSDHATLVGVTNKATTDANGEVKITFRDIASDEIFSYVEGLSAEATGYIVKLSFDGKNFVDAGDIYWVDLGLTYVDSAVAEDNPERTTQFWNAPMNIEKESNYTVSDTKGWRIGYKVVARSRKFQYYHGKSNLSNYPLNYIHEFGNVSGVSVDYTYDRFDKGQDGIFESKNNVATMRTTVEQTTTVVGTLNVAEEDYANVTFTFYDENGDKVSYRNVGVGKPLIATTSLKLTTNWNKDGAYVKLIAPETVNENTATTVYVLVADKYGNVIPDATVTYSIEGVNETAETDAGKTDEKGVAKIALPAPGDISAFGGLTSVVKVKVNGSIEESVTIYYQEDQNIAFTLAESDTAKAVEVGSDLKTIKVYFTNEVEEQFIKDKQFKFVEVDGTVTYTVKSAVCADPTQKTCITLTLDKAIENQEKLHKLTIESYTDDMGITYSLMDKYGQVFADTTNEFKPVERVKK